MKKLLITGANGFIGSYFINQYKETHNIKTFSFLNDDFETIDYNDLDAIVYLSALVHQMAGASTDEYEKVNVTQTLQLANKAKDSGVHHFIFMSTIKVYGGESDTVYTETTSCHPIDEYGMSKLRAEEALKALVDEDFIVSIIRTPIVYGAGVKANIMNLINLIQKVPILPLGNTHNQRSMVYIGNLCSLLETILERQANGIFLACDDNSLSTTQFIREIAVALGKECYLLDIPLFETLLRYLKPTFHQRLFGNLIVDNTETKERLKFKNPYSTTEGIKTMMKNSIYG